MEIKDKVYIVLTKDKKKVMTGLSKSIRFMEDVESKERHISAFSTKDSAERWSLSGRIENLYPYRREDLEVVEVDTVYKL